MSSSLTKLENYLTNLLNEYKSNYNAVIFDVDDTIVNIDKPPKIIKMVNTDIFIYPGIPQIVNLAKKAHYLGYKIIILTARPKESFLSTIFNLDILKIKYDSIYMNTYNQPNEFKIKVREYLNKKYNILFTIGDQIGDVDGPDGILGIKLPSLDSNKIKLYKNNTKLNLKL